MCGIAGFYGRFDVTHLDRMTRSLAHRGPDDEGVEILTGDKPGDNVGLGHRRLSIIDLGGGHQPMWSADGSIGIIFNGEIYNYQELRRELEQAGGHFRTTSDTEVIIEGWRLRGPRILPRLAGMFAFGIWDARTREWILARDRHGIKPLYYAHPAAGEVVFASEIKPLLGFLPRTRTNLRALYEYLLYSWTPGPDTIFDGIRHVPPGTWGRWSSARPELKPERYVERPIELRKRDCKTAAAELAPLLDRAVQSHLVADVPVGLTLSGGLDSSAILSSMARLRDSRSIDAYTIGFGLADDETPHATMVAQHLGANHHTRTASSAHIERDFSRVIRSIEEPIAHPVLQTTLEAAAFAREHVKVVLIGEGADELFLGYPQYRLLRSPFCYAPPRIRQNLFLAVACLMPPPRQLLEMIAPEFRDRDAFEEAAHRFDRYFQNGDFQLGGQAFEFENPLVANQLLRIDKLTMSHSLEARVPFLDNDLVDWASALPLETKFCGGMSKGVLRQAMAGRLPEPILYRPKTGRGGTQALLPYIQGLLERGPLAGLISREAIRKRGWLDADKVLAYFAAAKNPAVRWHPVERRRRAKFAYALAVLEQWAREFLDKDVSQ